MVDQETYEQVPVEARDLDRPLTVHWAGDPGATDPFLDGAYWALAWSLEQVFGDFLGTLINQATVQQVERWNGSAWELVA